MIPNDQLTAIKERVSQLLELLDQAVSTSLMNEENETLNVAIQLAERVHSTLNSGQPVHRLNPAPFCDDRR